MTETDRRIAEYEKFGREWLVANPPLLPPPPPTIHYTELPEDTTGGAQSTEWNYYRREAERLLAAGHEGRWALVVGEQVIGIWDAEVEAKVVAAERYPQRPVLIHRILTREPLFPTPTFFYRCHVSPSPPHRAAG